MEQLQPGIYQHFKGNKYRLLGVGKHSETLEPMVVYEALYENPEGRLWVRPLSLFVEVIDKPEINYRGPRFVYVGPAEN